MMSLGLKHFRNTHVNTQRTDVYLGSGEDYITRSLMLCIPYIIPIG
jgi:hypothetical protein